MRDRCWIGLLAMALLLTACGGGFEESGGDAKGKEPIKIGVITGLSGPYVNLGRAQKRGAELAIEQLGGKVAGHNISVIVRDGQIEPDTALREAKSLVQSADVDFLTGCVSAATTLPMNQVAQQAGVPYIGTCQTEQLTRPPRYDPESTYHIAPLPSQVISAYLPWLCQNLGKEIYLLVPDYAWGHEQNAAYVSEAADAGCKIAGRSWFPLGTTDFTPYIPKVRSANPDVLVFGGAGRDQINFMKQAEQFDLASDMEIFLNLEDLSFDREMGFGVVDNTYAATHFYWKTSRDYPEMQRFVDTYQEAYGTPPSGYAVFLYNAVHLVADAVQKGQYQPAQFRKYMEGLEFSYAQGPQWIRPCDHQSFQNTYVLEGLSEEEATQEYGSAENNYRRVVDTIKASEDHAPTCAQVDDPL